MNIILTLSFRIMRHNLLHLLTLALALMSGGEMAWGETVTIWSEDWRSTADNIGVKVSQVTNENATYSEVKPGVSLYDNTIASGGPSEAPELQIKADGGSLKATIKSLKGCTGDLTLTFYSNKSLTVKASGSVSVVNGTTTDKKYTYTIKNAINGFSITFKNENKSANARIDDIQLVGERPSATVNLNASGYATFASSKPLDFTSAEGVTAWKVKEVDGTSIGFEQITGAVQAGTGVLLMGNASTSVEIPYAENGDELSDNKLVGITKDTEISVGTYYGLKGTSFVPVNAGTIPAGKALLPAEAVPSSVKAFTFVFDDVDGIRTVKTVTPDEAQAIFNLSGQRLPKTQRGLNIINGKKVIMK